MSRKRTILKGTFILTFTGFLTRFIGFFYRVFLSHTFGEEGVGLYQLIFPVYALCFSITSAGFQTAISRSVAHKVSLGKTREAREILYVGLGITLLLSLITTYVLQQNAAAIALHMLGDARCEPLLIAVSYGLPFAAIHSGIIGYYYGLKQTEIPALSQFMEQIIRVVAVYCLYSVALKKQLDTSITLAVIGLVAGELASSFICVKSLHLKRSSFSLPRYLHHTSELSKMAIPLTANRILLNLLQSVEAISIPARLQLSGLSISDSLSTFGVLTGMALPCILFPSAITNSVSIMLLPTVTEVQAADDKTQMKRLISKVSAACFALGCACTVLFLIFGSFIGGTLFGSDSAGKFIVTMAWICPFLYTNTTLVSILNGLGKATLSFVINTIGLLIRIGSVFFMIPLFGIIGYLWGLLLSQLIVSILCAISLRSYFQK